ncbi:hypothetical protein FB107DRAFT_173759, partial [Schizophyllum commune]
RILPWFINVLSTRRAVFYWAPGRENELQRMVCALLLVPLNRENNVLWDEVNMTQYHTCISRVLQALTSALLEFPGTPTTTTTNVATLSMTLLALGNRLDDLDWKSKLLQNGALFDTITTAYSSLSEPPSLAVLRLRPVIWYAALVYLRNYGRLMDEVPHFVIALRWLYLCPDWSEIVAIAMYRLLCPRPASRLHMMCHAIDLFVKEDSADGDAAFDLLVAHFTRLLLATLGYGSIDSVLQIIGHSGVSAAFKSAFLVRPGLPLAKLLKADERLPATLAISLFWYLIELVSPIFCQGREVPVLRVLNQHVTDYCEVLAEALDYDEISVDLLLDLTSVVLNDPQLSFLAISDALAASVATQLRKGAMGPDDQPTGSALLRNLHVNSMYHCLYLDALCAARANSELVGKRLPDASRALHSALLSLKSTYHDTCKSELTNQLKDRYIPLAVALALKSMHGREALVEWVDDLPTLVQDPKYRWKVAIPFDARCGEDLSWYRLFTSDPDKHIHAPGRYVNWSLHISELVSFEEAVERMQKTDTERAAREAQRSSQGHAAEAHSNDDAEVPGREHGGLEDQGDIAHTQNHIVARLGALGAWVARPFKGVRPFLGT